MFNTDKPIPEGAYEAYRKLYCLIAMEEIIKEFNSNKEFTPRAQYNLKAKILHRLDECIAGLK